MDPRKSENFDSFRTKLPGDYLDLVSKAFDETFKDNLDKQQSFVADGFIFKSEIVLGLSLTTKDQLRALTCCASMDFDIHKLNAEDILKVIVDTIGSFFSSHFAAPKDEYAALWTKLENEKNIVYVRISRENLILEKMTRDFLGDEEFSPESAEEGEQKDKKKLH